MRRAAVHEQVFDRPDEADDEVEIGRGAGEEPGRDAPRDRTWWCVFASRRPGEQRPGQRVR
jgi:hypothetical protein